MRYLIALAIVLISFLSLTCVAAEEVKKPEKGKLLPKFTFKTIDGKEDKIENYLGKKPLIVNFWGSWCPPCRREAPELRAFYEKHKKDNLVILSIAVGDKLEKMKEFMKKEPMPWIHAMDTDGLFEKWGFKGVPTNIFVAPDGKVIDVSVGALTLDDLKGYEELLFPKRGATSK